MGIDPGPIIVAASPGRIPVAAVPQAVQLPFGPRPAGAQVTFDDAGRKDGGRTPGAIRRQLANVAFPGSGHGSSIPKAP